MSDTMYAAVRSFLEMLGKVMAQPVKPPDFDDLYIPDPEGEDGVLQVTPEEIGALVATGLQRAEMAERQAAEEARLAGQAVRTEALRTRLAALPAPPGAAALLTLDADAGSDVQAAIDDADDALRRLDKARGGGDDAFEQIADFADQEIERRDRLIAAAHEAVAGEAGRRATRLAGLDKALAGQRGQIPPEVSALLANQAGKSPPSIQALRKALAAADAALQSLRAAAETATPEGFDARDATTQAAIDALPDAVRRTRALGEQKRTEDRKTVVADLGTARQAIDAKALTMLPDDVRVTAWTDGRAEHQAAHDKLRALVDKGSPEDFAAARQAAESSYLRTATARDALRDALDAETARRAAALDRLAASRDAVKLPKMVQGTGEQRHCIQVQAEALGAWRRAEALRDSRPATEFDRAAAEAAAAVDALVEAAAEATTDAATRADDFVKLKQKVTTMVTEGLAALAPLAACPIPGLADAVGKAFRTAGRQLVDRIRSVDPVADQANLAELGTLLDNTRTLAAAITHRLRAVDLDPVKGNVEITGLTEALLTALANGIGPTAIALVDQIDRESGKITDRYMAIAGLRSRYEEVVADRTVRPDLQKEMAAFPRFEADRDSFTKGALTSQTTRFQGLVLELEKAIEKKTATEAVKASDVYKFTQLMESGAAGTLAELERLVTESIAQRGGIRDTYRSSFDRPDAFSVEIAVPIGGKAGIVVHAHCEPGGTAKPGNACHVKLYKYRFDPGGIKLSAPLRTALLHSAADNLRSAQDKGLA